MQNDTVLLASNIGTTVAASSDVHPMTSAKLRGRRVHLSHRRHRVGGVTTSVDRLALDLISQAPRPTS